MSDPLLNFVSQSATQVTVEYESLPDDTDVVFVSEFGDKTSSGGTFAGSGHADIATDLVSPGQYHLCAHVAGQEVAETVKFYVAGAPDNL